MIDPIQLCKSKPYWIEFNSVENNPKHLVLSDCRRSAMPALLQFKIHIMAQQWIKDGFKLYIWQMGNLVALNKDNVEEMLTSNKVLAKMEAVTIDEVAKQARKQHKISKEQIHLIDDRLLMALL